MNRIRLLATALLFIAMQGVALWPAYAADPVVWKVQNLFPNKRPLMGESLVNFASDVSRVTGGNFKIQVYDPGAIVPPPKCLDAIVSGKLDGCWWTPAMLSGEHPAVHYFANVPFGHSSFAGLLPWLVYGEGQALREELYNKLGATHLTTYCMSAETSGWFLKPVENLDGLKGLKMRIFGLGALTLKKLGLSPQAVSAVNLAEALEKGNLDAAEFTSPATDSFLGLSKVAKHNYFPAWHQGPACLELMMNKERFDALPDTHKAALEITAKAYMAEGVGTAEKLNAEAMVQYVREDGVQIHRWTDQQLAAFEKAWNEVRAELGANDEYFRRVADSYARWLETYKPWRDATHMNSEYQK